MLSNTTMGNEKHHMQSFFSLGVILVVLLSLTAITVLIANIDFGVISIAVVLLVASIKGFIVLAHFMHLKYENRFTQIIVGAVFALFALTVLVTFFDYLFRT